MSWTWVNIDWSATGAWAQAFTTAAAVFATAWLQNRSASRKESRNRILALEAPATVARWIIRTYSDLQNRVRDNMSCPEFVDALKPSELQEGLDAIRQIPVPSLGDVELLGCVLDLVSGLSIAAESLSFERTRVLHTSNTIKIQGAALVAAHADRVIGSARRVERRVAGLVGREPQA